MLCYNTAATDYPGSIILKTLFRNFRRIFQKRFYAILRKNVMNSVVILFILSVFYMCFCQIKKKSPVIDITTQHPSTFDAATKLMTKDNKIIYLKEQGKDALQGYTAYYFSLKKIAGLFKVHLELFSLVNVEVGNHQIIGSFMHCLRSRCKRTSQQCKAVP